MSDNPQYDAVMKILSLQSSTELKILKEYLRGLEERVASLEDDFEDQNYVVRDLETQVYK